MSAEWFNVIGSLLIAGIAIWTLIMGDAATRIMRKERINDFNEGLFVFLYDSLCSLGGRDVPGKNITVEEHIIKFRKEIINILPYISRFERYKLKRIIALVERRAKLFDSATDGEQLLEWSKKIAVEIERLHKNGFGDKKRMLSVDEMLK